MIDEVYKLMNQFRINKLIKKQNLLTNIFEMENFAGPISFAQVLSTINCYNKELQTLQYSKQKPRSAVAIVIKKNSKKVEQNLIYDNFLQDQILILQRKVSIKDRFSGQLCFPGGRQQPNQVLLQTAIRQTFQQTNILLKKQNLIGCINHQVNFIIANQNKHQIQEQKKANFTIPVKKQIREMVIYPFVFVINDFQFDQNSIKLNHEQMQTHKWIKAIQFLKPMNMCWHDYTPRLQGLVRVYYYNKQVHQKGQHALKYINRALCPGFDIKMNHVMYGMTLHMITILYFNFSKKITNLLAQNRDKYSRQKRILIQSMLSNFKQIKFRCQQYFQFQLKRPIDDDFRMFQNALFNDMYRMRPKL